jgi:hypothetical protein
VFKYFQGFAVGNGALDTKYTAGSLLYFEYYHGMIGDEYAPPKLHLHAVYMHPLHIFCMQRMGRNEIRML